MLIAYALIALAIGAFLWRQTRIASLPDVGEPFDTAAYRAAARIPDDRNAFVPYWLAALMYREMSKAEADSFSNANFEWSRSDATFRGWVTEQDAAIALLLEGSARPEASLEMQVGMAETRVGMESNVLTAPTSWIATAALFKADRLRVEGDPASAWALLLAAVRAGRHVERAEPTQGGRTQGMMFAQYARAPVAAWAKDPAVSVKLLRQALEDLIAADALTPPLSASYRYQYLAALDPLAMPQVLIAQRDRERELAGRAPENFLGYLPALEAYLAGEPERSRRVLNLLVANDLAWCDRLPADRPAFAVPALRIYDPDPRAPTVNGAISRRAALLVGSSLIAPACHGGWMSSRNSQASIAGR